MASPILSHDAIIEILSHSPASVIAKSRVFNNQFNKLSYESWFSDLNINRTNSISGYFLQYDKRFSIYSGFALDKGVIGEDKISIDFLPPGKVKIKACDTSHGVLLCVNDSPDRGRVPNYIVCKPATKQYWIIPNPKTKYFTIALGLMVVKSDPFRFKIVRLSELRNKNNRWVFNLVCEVFDSDDYSWKRLANMELDNDFILNYSVAVAAYGFLHWLSTEKRVYRFCFETETWFSFPVPEELIENCFLKLVTYEGKLGIVSLESIKEESFVQLWVMKSWSGNSWVMVRDMILEDRYKPIWFPNNDVVSMAEEVGRIFNSNLEKNEVQELQIKDSKFSPNFDSLITYFPFFSDFQRVVFDRKEGKKIESNTKIMFK